MPPSPPLRLTDDQLATVMNAARTLPVADRDIFMRTVASVLAHQPILGDGGVARVCKQVQLRLWRAPKLDERRPHSGK
jgi:hypothetical protein